MKDDLEPRKKITYGRIKLGNKYPFFEHLAYSLKVVESEQFPTIAVSENGVLKYNTDFLNNRRRDDLLFLLSHEVLHMVLKHHYAAKQIIEKEKIDNDLTDKDSELNYYKKLVMTAADYVVNGILRKEDLTIDLGENFDIFYDKRFENMSLEEVYKFLKETDDESLLPPPDINIGELLGGTGSGEEIGEGEYVSVPIDEFDDESDIENDNIPGGEDPKEVWEEKMMEAYNYMKDRGIESSNVSELINDLHTEKINWKAYLRKRLRSLCKTKYNTLRPSRRGIVHNYHLPSIEGRSISVVVALDTSGSMTKKDLRDALSEVRGILKSEDNVEMKLLMHDSKIKKVVDIKASSNNRELIRGDEVKVFGRGGTNHKPVFKWCEDNIGSNKTNILICFTDARSSFPDKEPYGLKTIWVLNSNQEPPFGDIIKI